MAREGQRSLGAQQPDLGGIRSCDVEDRVHRRIQQLAELERRRRRASHREQRRELLVLKQNLLLEPLHDREDAERERNDAQRRDAKQDEDLGESVQTREDGVQHHPEKGQERDRQYDREPLQAAQRHGGLRRV